ncbi:MAG: hypothetical protein ABUS79_19380 [Pseudomonadota bacterium]
MWRAAVVLLWSAAVSVNGSTSCPRPGAVTEQLQQLVPSGRAEDPHDSAQLREDGDDLLVTLRGVDGAVLAVRRWPRTFGCDDLAAAVAVSIAAWDSDIHPEFSAELAARNTAPGENEPAAVATAVAPPPRQPPRAWTAQAGVAVGLGGALDAPAAAVDLVLPVWLRLPVAATWLRVEGEAQSTRTVSLPDGDARWRRWAAGFGIERGLSVGSDGSRSRLTWFALARLARLDLRGESFAHNHALELVDAGATAGLRLARPLGRWFGWAELAASMWPLQQDATELGSSASQRLPYVEAFLRIGAGVGASP